MYQSAPKRWVGWLGRHQSGHRLGKPALWLLALSLVVGIQALTGLGSPALSADATVTRPAPVAPATGSLQLASVRILGVPVITVASPGVGGDARAVSASERARIIEGNLTWLYDPKLMCSRGEALAESVLELGFLHGSDLACNTDHLGLGGAPDAVKVEVAHDPEGPLELVAVTPKRQKAWPLLTVTAEDARLNGVSQEALAQRWSHLLQRRLRYARQLLKPEALTQQWQRVLIAEALLMVMLMGVIGLSLASRRLARRWQKTPPSWMAHRQRLLSFSVHAGQNISRSALLLAAFIVLLMAGGLAFAVPSQLPLALDLLLQPGGLILKLVLLWLVAVAARVVLVFLLGQWRGNVDVLPEWRARRNQRYLSLRQVLGRLVDLITAVGGTVWILSDIPGVKEVSAAAVVAGGAVLGVMALVFQGLLRDFIAGLVVIFDDRYAIGDTVEINGVMGEVMDVGLLSTKLRCADQRVVVVQNSGFDQVVNHTKLRSGIDVRIQLSPGLRDIDAALDVVREEVAAFTSDPQWGPMLMSKPQLRGIDEVTATGITVSVLLITQAGQQWPMRRALLERLLTRLERQGVPLANQEWTSRPA